MSGVPPDSKDAIRAALERHGLHPHKRFGQHFLGDAAILDRIVRLSGTGPASVVLEVGPGLGALTARLLATGAAVVAVEIDHGLARAVRETLPDGDFLLLEQDVMARKGKIADEVGAALSAAVARRGASGFEVVSNLPYGISSSFLLALLAPPGPPLRTTVMLQSEVADALVAAPSTDAYSALAVSCQVFFAVTRAFEVPRRAFVPVPDVDSAVVVLVPRSGPRVATVPFARFVQVLFQGRRKALSTTLRDVLPPGAGASRLWLAEAGFDPLSRVEALAPDRLADLFQRVEAVRGRASPEGDIVPPDA